MASSFATKRLPKSPDDVALDGSEVRILLSLDRGSLAHFPLGPGETSLPVSHRTVEEIWYFLGGRGEMWRRLGELEEVVTVDAGICVTVPVGTHFQFRSIDDQPFRAVGVTMGPWPGEGEAFPVTGKWTPTVPVNAL